MIKCMFVSLEPPAKSNKNYRRLIEVLDIRFEVGG